MSDYGGGQDPASGMLVSTMNDLPGFRVDKVIGEVFGLTVRARNVGSSLGSTVKSLRGGELKGQTKMLVDSRMEAMDRLTEEARARGGNAVLAMRFETSVGERAPAGLGQGGRRALERGRRVAECGHWAGQVRFVVVGRVRFHDQNGAVGGECLARVGQRGGRIAEVVEGVQQADQVEAVGGVAG